MCGPFLTDALDDPAFGLVALVAALGAGAGERRGVLVEAGFAAGGAEVVSLAVVERPVLGGRGIYRHSANRIDDSGFLAHVVSCAPRGTFLDRSCIIRTDLNTWLSLWMPDGCWLYGLRSEPAKAVRVGNH